jgi:polysaccharide deacetylase family protein (PEP-CTERM system associated)
MSQNLLTIDLEEWFVVEILQNRYNLDDWDQLPSTLEVNCLRLLQLMRAHGVRATWFVVGWCAERHPQLIRRIADAGHEIACHSYRHRRVDSLSPEEFREDTERAQRAIFEACGVRPIGYRAPSWSLSEKVSWAFEILADLGFEYDSSVFPIKHDLYGMPTGPRQLFRMSFERGRFLYELPASTIRRWGQNLPFGGGGYLRHSPYWYTRRQVRRANAAGEPVVVYVHPWEIDPDPPQIDGLTQLQRFRVYGSTGTLLQKLNRLLSDFEFMAVSDYIRTTTRSRIGFERPD